MALDSRTPDAPSREEGTPRTPSWFPGHMHKAQKRLAQELEHVDVVLELRDARLPVLSGNPLLERLAGRRPRMLLFNKASLADPASNKSWREHFARLGVPALFLDAESRSGLNLLFPPLRELTRPAAEKFRRRGIRPPPQRIMVVGMPNVGKSTFINRLIRANRLKTAPTPGFTRGVTWVPLKQHYLLMDTPGIMLPRLASEADALRLGWIGAIKDSVIGVPRLAASLLAYLAQARPQALGRAYGLQPDPATTGADLLVALCQARRYYLPAGRPDPEKAGQTVLQDFRAGRLGRFTLEVAYEGAGDQQGDD